MILSAISHSGETLSPPDGTWTLRFNYLLPNTYSTPRHYVWTKVASGESGGYTITASSSTALLAHLAVYRNAVWHDSAGPSTGTSDTPTSPSVTTTEDNCMIVYIAGTDNNEVPYPESNFYPTGTNGREATERSYNSNGISLGLADKLLTSAGASGTAAWHPDGWEQWGAVTIALEPST